MFIDKNIDLSIAYLRLCLITYVIYAADEMISVIKTIKPLDLNGFQLTTFRKLLSFEYKYN